MPYDFTVWTSQSWTNWLSCVALISYCFQLWTGIYFAPRSFTTDETLASFFAYWVVKMKRQCIPKWEGNNTSKNSYWDYINLCNQFINLTCRSGFISLDNVIHFLGKVFIAVCVSKTYIKYLQETMTTYIMYLTLLATTYLHLSLSYYLCLITPPCRTHSPNLQ